MFASFSPIKFLPLNAGIRPELPTGGLIFNQCRRCLFEYRYNPLIYNLKFNERIFLARGYGYHVTKPISVRWVET